MLLCFSVVFQTTPSAAANINSALGSSAAVLNALSPGMSAGKTNELCTGMIETAVNLGGVAGNQQAEEVR